MTSRSEPAEKLELTENGVRRALQAERTRSEAAGTLKQWHRELEGEVHRLLVQGGLPEADAGILLKSEMAHHPEPGKRIEGLAYLMRVAHENGSLADVIAGYLEALGRNA